MEAKGVVIKNFVICLFSLRKRTLKPKIKKEQSNFVKNNNRESSYIYL